MNFVEFLQKTEEKKRGYTHRVYKTILEKDILTFCHYNTVILKANLKTKKVLYFYGWSSSDLDSIAVARYVYNLKGKFTKLGGHISYLLPVGKDYKVYHSHYNNNGLKYVGLYKNVTNKLEK
jgi:CRISPR/Cas system CMR-associated protein Cmr5 small subunit